MAKPLTFADVLPVTPLSSHEYTVTLGKEWTIGSVPNGGYTTSAFLICARTHMQRTHAGRAACADPINLHLEFMRRTAVGPATFVVRDVKIGARISNLHLTLFQDYYNTGEPGSRTAVVEGYITLTNLAAEAGLSLDTAYTLLPPPLPADLGRLASPAGDDGNYIVRRKDIYQDFRPATRSIQMFLVRPDRRPASHPLSLNDQWSRLTPLGRPGRWTNDGLGFLVDMFPQTVERYINADMEAAALLEQDDDKLARLLDDQRAQGKLAKYWYPTLSLNLDVKKLLPAEGVEWLFTRTKAKTIRNGRLDLDVEVWDAQGQLIATSSHAALIVDASRNTSKRGGKNKL